ncbi:DUF397 domain-containing protein [Amycolatopsis sp. NPDC059027]|uniref:DUF397 domain-containing protein n=1 Tax=unclassified Amycolatopsis TaxID=2618356 RepID=UPI00366FF991
MNAPDLTGAHWRKSTRSGGAQNCVEVAQSATWAAVRDTKNRDAGALTFSAEAFTAFLAAAKNS